MKALLLAAFVFFSLDAAAQQNGDSTMKKLREQLNQYQGKKLNVSPLRPLLLDTFQLRNKSFTLPGKKPGVYPLRQDRMPCIVPDTNALVAIPNAFGKPVLPFRTEIPNASPEPLEKK
jgi:hypothetical protein